MKSKTRLLIALASLPLLALCIFMWKRGHDMARPMEDPVESSKAAATTEQTMIGAGRSFLKPPPNETVSYPLVSGAGADTENESSSAFSGEFRWSDQSTALLAYVAEQQAAGLLNGDALSQQFAEISPAISQDERRRLVTALAQELSAVPGLEIATDFFQGLAELSDRQQFAHGLIDGVFVRNKEEAINWAAGQGDEGLAEELYGGIGRKWAAEDTDSARAWAETLPGDGKRLRAMEGVVFQWAQIDMDAAFEWVQGIADTDAQDQVLGKMAKLLAVSDPERTAEWIATLPSSKSANESLHFTIHQWAARDTSAAVSWIEQLADETLRQSAILAAAGAWAEQDPPKAAAWVESLAPEAQQFPAMQGVARRWAAQDPGAALEWSAARAQDRDGLMDLVLRMWATADRSGAESGVAGLQNADARKFGEQVLSSLGAGIQDP